MKFNRCQGHASKAPVERPRLKQETTIYDSLDLFTTTEVLDTVIYILKITYFLGKLMVLSKLQETAAGKQENGNLSRPTISYFVP